MADAASRWASRAHAEDASADHFEALADRMVDLGVPAVFADRLRIAASDERRHAVACRNVVERLGGVLGPRPSGALGLPPGVGTDAHTAAAEEVTFLLAAGESVAIRLLEAARAEPCADWVSATITPILGDERSHAKLGWDLLDALVLLDASVVAAWSQVLPRMAVFVTVGSVAAAPEAGDRVHGVLDKADVERVAKAALARDVAPQLGRRGLWGQPPTGSPTRS